MNKTFSQNFLFKSQEWEETDKWVKVKGIASDDSTRDLQGELIKVSGADLSYAGISSMLAWEHGGEKDASVYIGPIDKAYREGTKLIIEGKIMKNLEQGRKVIDLMKAMKDMGREMQLSVEGKVIKRNPIDKKIIERWKFTHCALTLLPQNRKTSLSFSKSENKDEHIFDHTDPKTGKRVIVKSDKSIEVIEGEIEKTITAENIETKKEDLEKKAKYLTKSKVINYIIGKFETQDDLEKSERIFNLIEEVRTNSFNTMEGITKEVISKAEELLKKSQEELENLKKSEPSEENKKKEETTKKEEESEKKEEKVEKSEKSSDKKEEKEDSEKEDEKKEEEDVEKSFQEGHQDEQKMGYDEVMKAMKGMGKEDMKKMYGAMKKMMGDDVKKSETEEGEKKEEKIEKSEESAEKKTEPNLYEQMAEVINGNEDLKKSFLAMEEKISKIENTPIQKSVSGAGYVERFDKSENKEEEEEKNELSLSKNRKEVSDALLDASGIRKGENVDHTMLKAVQVFEATGKMEDRIVKSLAEDHNVFIKK